MKVLAVSIFILLMMTQVFSKWLVVFSFQLNQQVIAKNECVNRYRPALKCKGKCVLMKKMQKEQDEQGAGGVQKIEIPGQVLSSVHYFSMPATMRLEKLITCPPCGNSGRPVDRPRDVFHPPLIS